MKRPAQTAAVRKIEFDATESRVNVNNANSVCIAV
jgi:hypothetical protein